MSVEVSRLSGFPNDDLGDAALAARISRGDMEAFQLLMNRFNQMLYRVVRSILKNDALAEDAIQNSCLRAYRSMGKFLGQSKLATWMVRIVTNEALSHLRRSTRRAEVIVSADNWRSGPVRPDFNEINGTGPTETEDAAERPDAAAYRREVGRRIEGKIDQLPEAFRPVFVLRAVEEMSVEETATCLGLPPATVRTRFICARGLLRESLSHEIDLGMETVFGFAGDRCKRITDRVMQILIHEQATRYSAPVQKKRNTS